MQEPSRGVVVWEGQRSAEGDGTLGVWTESAPAVRPHGAQGCFERVLLRCSCCCCSCCCCCVQPLLACAAAGSNAYSYRLLAEQSEEDIVSVVETNVLGVMLGCREVRVVGGEGTLGRGSLGLCCFWRDGWLVGAVDPRRALLKPPPDTWGGGRAHAAAAPHADARVRASLVQAIRVMREQPSGGHIFNMDGAGACRPGLLALPACCLKNNRWSASGTGQRWSSGQAVGWKPVNAQAASRLPSHSQRQ